MPHSSQQWYSDPPFGCRLSTLSSAVDQLQSLHLKLPHLKSFPIVMRVQLDEERCSVYCYR